MKIDLMSKILFAKPILFHFNRFQMEPFLFHKLFQHNIEVKEYIRSLSDK